jgi:Ankyrin repeats (3 copies)
VVAFFSLVATLKYNGSDNRIGQSIHYSSAFVGCWQLYTGVPVLVLANDKFTGKEHNHFSFHESTMKRLIPAMTRSTSTSLDDARDNLRFWVIRDASTVLDILKAHPSLARETFVFGCVSSGKKGQSLSPLSSLVAQQAPLDIVQRVLDLYPEAALGTSSCSGKQLAHQCLPIHVASAAGGPNSFQMIQYLAHRFPQTVSIPDASGNLPLHHALQSPFERTTLPAIQCLVELYPQAIVQANKNGETPLQYAVENAYCGEVVDYLASQLPCTFCEFSFGNSLTFNLPRARSMTRLLPHLKSLTCRPAQWTWDGLLHLLETMTTSTSTVTKLVLEWIPRAFFTSNHRMGQLLKELLRTSSDAATPLCELRLHIKNAWFDKNRNSDILCLETLQGILLSAKQHPTSTFRFSLSLHCFQLYKESLQDFIQLAQPVRVSLNSCTIFENTSLCHNTPRKCYCTHHPAHLERLELIQTRMPNTVFQELLGYVQHQMPNLKHLKLIFRRAEDFGDIRGLLDLTDFVASMLPRLHTLTLEGVFVSTKLLSPFAKPDSHLNDEETKYLKALDANCYLEFIQYGQMLNNLQFYSALNHFGKPIFRRDINQASKETFVKVMLALNNFEDIKESEVKDQVRFGLLSECPSLWSGY